MIPFHNAMSIVGGVEDVRSYAEFQAYIATLAAGGLVNWFAAGSAAPAGSYRMISPSAAVVAANGGFALFGTSWGPASANGYRRNVSHLYAAAVHGFPDVTVKDDQMANGREVFVKIVSGPSVPSLASVTRNGLTSTSSASATDAMLMDELRYFDPTLGPMLMQPKLGLGPTPFTW